MSHLSFLSQSGNFFSESSSLNESSLLGLGLEPLPNNRQGNNNETNVQQLTLPIQSLAQYPQLLHETVTVLSQRASDPKLRQWCKQHLQVYGELERKQQLQPQSREENKQQQGQEKKNVFVLLKKITDQINQLYEDKQKQTNELVELDDIKMQNRQNLQQLAMLVQREVSGERFVNVSQEYKQGVRKIIEQYEDEKLAKLAQASISSENVDDDERSLGEVNQQKIGKKQKEIEKLQKQINIFKTLVGQESLFVQRLKEEIKRYQSKRQQLYKEISVQDDGSVSLRRDILGELVVKFIQKNMDERKHDYGIDRPMREYVEIIGKTLQETVRLRRQRAQLNAIRAEKTSKGELLAKRLAELENERGQVEKAKKGGDDESEELERQRANQLNNEDLLLKVYKVEETKIRNERLQVERKSQEANIEERQNTTRDDTEGQRVFVEASLGWIQTWLPNTNAKQLVRWGMATWALIITLLFILTTLVKYEVWPAQVVDTPEIVVHRYQGKRKVVDGEVVNVSRIEGQNDAIIQEQQRGEVIVVETLPVHKTEAWTDSVMLEYV